MTTRQTAKAATAAPNAMSPGALARRWDCCRQTIYNMINDDELRSFKVRTIVALSPWMKSSVSSAAVSRKRRLPFDHQQPAIHHQRRNWKMTISEHATRMHVSSEEYFTPALPLSSSEAILQ